MVVLVAVLLLLGAGAAWWWFRPGADAVPPAVPADLRDAEVRAAVESARQKVLDDPKSAAAWGSLGLTLHAHQLEADADRCYERSAALDPADPRWPYARGWLALKHSADAAAPFLRQAAGLDGRPEYRSAARLQLAEILLERGRADEAEALLLVESASNPRVAFGLGLAAAARGDGASAATHLTAARVSPFARRKATAQLALLARSRGDAAAAEAFEREAAGMPEDAAWPDPLQADVSRLRVGGLGREREFDRQMKAGLDAARAGRFEQAVGLLRGSVGSDPTSASAHFNLAIVLSAWAETERGRPPARDRFREAAAEARRATELKPDFARAYLIWGTCLRHLGETAAAVEPFRRGVACLPTDADLQLGLGESLLDTGDLAGAEAHLESARRLAPNDPGAANALERLRSKKK
jgi:tetratricopeptide (TPR) repeat protein